MPIYEFVCEACGQLVERLQKVSDPPPKACPECGGKMAKIMSRNSFQLKGGRSYGHLSSSARASSKPADQAPPPAPEKGAAAAKAPAEAKPPPAETKKD